MGLSPTPSGFLAQFVVNTKPLRRAACACVSCSFLRVALSRAASAAVGSILSTIYARRAPVLPSDFGEDSLQLAIRMCVSLFREETLNPQPQKTDNGTPGFGLPLCDDPKVRVPRGRRANSFALFPSRYIRRAFWATSSSGFCIRFFSRSD